MSDGSCVVGCAKKSTFECPSVQATCYFWPFGGLARIARDSLSHAWCKKCFAAQFNPVRIGWGCPKLLLGLI